MTCSLQIVAPQMGQGWAISALLLAQAGQGVR